MLALHFLTFNILLKIVVIVSEKKIEINVLLKVEEPILFLSGNMKLVSKLLAAKVKTVIHFYKTNQPM